MWKWLSGLSTLAATILFGMLIVNFPPQKSALTHQSLGDLRVDMSWDEQNIWSAAGTGDLAAISEALQQNIPIDSRIDGGLTALHLAVLFEQRTAVELLVSEGADGSLADDEGNTALHMAAFLGQTDIVRTLLAAGADPSVRNQLGFNSLDLVNVTWSSSLEEYYHETEKTLSRTLDLERIRTERPIISRLLTASNRFAPAMPTISLGQATMTGNTTRRTQHALV